MLRLSALAVTAAFCALLLKRGAPELGLALTLAAGTLLLGQAMDSLAGVRGLMDTLARTAGLAPEVWKPVVKTVGIGIVAKLSSAICRDAGAGGVAAFLETAGTALALFTALPLVETVFDTLAALL